MQLEREQGMIRGANEVCLLFSSVIWVLSIAMRSLFNLMAWTDMVKILLPWKLR